MRLQFLVLIALSAVGCAHQKLAGGDLNRVRRPAFISRIEQDAGPKSDVFQADSSYKAKLQRLDPKEADRRLQLKLTKGMTRWEVAERLRATTLSQIAKEAPWSNSVDPVAVARALQSFLVEEVPANVPDYELLKPLRADVVVEFVIEEYGLRSRGGRAGAYLRGYGRMFTLKGRQTLWHRAFEVDQLDAQLPHVDPFRVAKEPERYRAEITKLVDAAAEQFAKDLTPEDRQPGASPPEESEAGPTKPTEEELPAPDPI